MSTVEATEVPKPANTSLTTSNKKEKSKKKRRRVSKHILDSTTKKEKSITPRDDDATKTEEGPSKRSKVETTTKERALAYLQQWQDDTKNWKFNKKLQTWLIRNMYDASLVPKHSFAVLTSYILPNASLRERISKEATEKAVRYQQEHGEGNIESSNELSEHDRRKEYKRARKVLEALDSYQA